jgi:C2 domain
MDESTEIVMLFVRAAGMKSGKAGNTFGAADPFFEVKNDDSKIVARSVVFRNDLNPQWPPIKLDLEALCQGDPNRKITLAFYDWNKNDVHELLGEVSTDLDEMRQAAHSYQSQRSVGFLDKQEAYDLGKSGRVFIYDIIQTTGVPTFGTLNKKSFESNVPSETDTEPETDSNTQSSGYDDQDEAIMTPEDVSVCPSVVSVASRASTIMHANGDASPRPKAKPTFEPIRVTKNSPMRGKSLFSGNIAQTAQKSGEDEFFCTSVPGPLGNQEAIPIEWETGNDAVVVAELKGSMECSQGLEPLLAAEQRGAEMALHEVTDEGRNQETSTGEMWEAVEDNEARHSGDTGDSAIAENVRDLLCEIGDLLGQVNMKTPQRKPRTEPKTPRVSLLPLRRGSNVSIPTKAGTCPDESSSESSCSPGSKTSSTKPLSLTVAEEPLMPLCDVSESDFTREKASLEDAQCLMNLMKGDGSIAKTKQRLDRPKKEYLSY